VRTLLVVGRDVDFVTSFVVTMSPIVTGWSLLILETFDDVVGVTVYIGNFILEVNIPLVATYSVHRNVG
jgi:hypothetical protein